MHGSALNGSRKLLPDVPSSWVVAGADPLACRSGLNSEYILLPLLKEALASSRRRLS